MAEAPEPPAREASPGPERPLKPWVRPTLTRWGDLAELTRGGGGASKEQPSKTGGGFTRF
ncbi:MAG: lasso RiPP family leader peptide-containing protein [Gemmatimonadota bacterium]